MDTSGLFDHIPEKPEHNEPSETVIPNISPAPEPDEPERDAVQILDIPTTRPAERPSASFYRETVRNESYSRADAKFRKIIALVLTSCLIGGVALGFGYGAGSRIATNYWIPRMSDDSGSLKQYTINAGYLTTNNDVSYGFSYAALLSQVEPSVVRITTTKGISVGSGYYTIRPGNDVRGAGTGMLFHETPNKYYIVTNAHVTTSSTGIYISIEDSGYITATLVGSDDIADVAVISVDKTDAYNAGVESVKLITFGDSDATKVGDVVLAIGNALGEGNSVTDGIISAKNRVISIDGVRFTVTQTNAAINEGNSGGPLINLNGEVIGMNTAKLRENNVEGMGYSIPSNVVVPVIEQIMRGGKAMLGVSGSDVTEAFRMIYDTDIAGALVREVIPDSGAWAAGIVIDDVIVNIGGEAVGSFAELKSYLSAYTPGDTVAVTVYRNGKFLEVDVTLGVAD